MTAGLLAVYPADVLSGRTLLLEPWMNLACLLAANAAFRDGRLASPRWLAWAGVAFGCGVAIKFWAAVPAAVLLAACLIARPPAQASRARRAGAAASAARSAASRSSPGRSPSPTRRGSSARRCSTRSAGWARTRRSRCGSRT